MKTFRGYAIVVALCLSMIGMCFGSEVFSHTHHDSHIASNVTITSHAPHAHVASSLLQLTSAHKSHKADSSVHCCQSSPKEPFGCVQAFVLPDTVKTFRCSLVTVFSPQITISSSTPPAMDCISGLSTTKNPSLGSLRTIILLT